MKRLLAFALALLLMLSVAAPVFAAPTDEKTLRHTVARIYVGDLYSTDEVFYESEWEPYCTGTAFFIGSEGENPRYLITNQHVIDYYLKWNEGLRTNVVNEKGQLVAYARTQIRVYFEKDDYVEAYVVEVGDPANAGVEDIKHPRDFAILRLTEPTDKRAALPICIPTQAVSDANRKVITVGYPSVADNEVFKSITISGEKDSHITAGMVNKIFTETGTGVQILEFDAKINHGSSGGPLILDNGAAIGVTTWSVNDSDQELYYAVGMETLKPYLDRNNIPYTLIDESASGVAAKDTDRKTVSDWLLYGILGAAIIGVIVVLIVLLRKPAKKPAPPTKSSKPVVTPPQTAARTLIGVEGPLKDRRYAIEKGKAIYIGRDKSKCKVLFPDKTPGVSSVHCRISFDGSTATITDLNSSYGTAVDGKKLTPNSPTRLHRGLSIDIGSQSNRFTLQ